MDIDTKRLTPGMVLEQDIVGKSGKTMIARHTKLTEVHIEFIDKFLIDKVSVTPLGYSEKESLQSIPINKQTDEIFESLYKEAVLEYKKLFSSWSNNIPIQMYDVREMSVSLFEDGINQSFKTIIQLPDNHDKINAFFYKSVAISLLSIYIAYTLNYEKKEWLQIGFSALLSDCGMAKFTPGIRNKDADNEDQHMHPLYSYKMVENVTTLTQQAKLGILQHHERLDGSGYPAKTTQDKIHPYARIIAVSDYFFNHYSNNDNDIINLLQKESGKLDDKVISILINSF